MAEREHCERVGCGRFTSDLIKIQVSATKRKKLCSHCRAHLLDKTRRKFEEEDNLFKMFAIYVKDRFLSIEGSVANMFDSGVSGYTKQVAGVTLWYPWKDFMADIEDEEIY